MNKLILYGLDLSPAVRTVKLTLEALDIDYEYKIINIQSGEHLKKEFWEINPQHTIPTINDNGHIVWESNAIITYLVGKYGKDDSLYPEDLIKRSKIDQRLHYTNGVLISKLSRMTRPIFKGISTEFDTDAVTSIREALEFMEIFLKNDSYIAGKSLSVADFAFAAIIETIAHTLTIDPEQYPKVTDWINRLSILPYYDEINVKPVIGLSQILKEKIEENRKSLTKDQ